MDRGIGIVPDQRPEQNFFQRSDNFAFARLGIVAQTLSSYDMHTDYHRPSDEPDTMDFDHMTVAVRAGLEAARIRAITASRLSRAIFRPSRMWSRSSALRRASSRC